MTIQDLGSVGELIAAVATIATLFYLAMQIRAGTVVARAEAKRGAQSAGVPAQLAIAQDPELAALLLKGLADYPKLDPVDATRFAVLLPSLLDGVMQIMRDSDLGLADDGRSLVYRCRSNRRLLRQPTSARRAGAHRARHDGDRGLRAFRSA